MAASSSISRPVMILIIVAVAAVAAFGTWWFVLRDSAAPSAEVIRRPETFDAGVLRDSRYAALRAPARYSEPPVRGRQNPFAPAGPQNAASSVRAPEGAPAAPATSTPEETP